MLDSDDVTALTGHAELVATYADLVTNATLFRQSFPHSEVILIDRGLGDPTDEATVMDIETGALTIGDIPARYDRWHSQGRAYITVYCNRSNRPAVDQALGDRKAWHWEATLDGTVIVPEGVPLRKPAVVQCLTAGMLGLHADGNLVLEDGWHPRIIPAVRSAVIRDLNLAISQHATLGSDLHKLAVLLEG